MASPSKNLNFEQLSPKDLAPFVVSGNPEAIKLSTMLLSRGNDDPLQNMIGADVEFYVNKLLAQKLSKNEITISQIVGTLGFDAKTFLSLYVSYSSSDFTIEQITPQWELRKCKLFLKMLDCDPSIATNLTPYMKKISFASKKDSSDTFKVKEKALSNLSIRPIVFALLIKTFKNNNVSINFTEKKGHDSTPSPWAEMFDGTIMPEIGEHNAASFIISTLHSYCHELSYSNYWPQFNQHNVEQKIAVLEHDYFLLDFLFSELGINEKEFWETARQKLSTCLIDKLEHQPFLKAIQEKKLITQAVNSVMNLDSDTARQSEPVLKNIVKL